MFCFESMQFSVFSRIVHTSVTMRRKTSDRDVRTTAGSVPTIYFLIGSLIAVSFSLPVSSSTKLTKDTPASSTVQQTCMPYPEESRFNCWPYNGIPTLEECSARRCCWDPPGNISASSTKVPSCFYPGGYQLYSVKTLKKMGTSYYVTLELNQTSNWPNDVLHLVMDITMETNSRLHFKIYDPYVERYEVPIALDKTEEKVSIDSVDYNIDIPNEGPFYITITRKSTGQVLFNTRDAAPLVFADQYLQIGSYLSSHWLYGLGEHIDEFLQSTQWTRKAMWARDNGFAGPGMAFSNSYGSHPFYLNMEADHKSHGVFFLNSNAMEMELQPAPAITYRTIGGVLDFYIFTGPTPDNVVQQYTQLVGRSFMPPYWALGFHLSRYGYLNIQNLTKVIKRTRAARMPYDSQWTDLDATRNKLDWTYDYDGKWTGFDKLVQDLHDHGQHYNMLIDPFISMTQPTGTYKPYTDGLEMDVFVKSPDGKTNTVGKGWPGHCVWVDFWHPNATAYWTKSARDYHNIIPFDSLMTDMNEPSNYVAGSYSGCPNNTLEFPPWIPRDLVGQSLKAWSLCASARQYLSTHYNLHNLYGHSQAMASKKALDSVRGKRSFVITRSTYSGSGAYAGHWSGDITSTWKEMNYTITGLLSFQLYGIPFWGSDICGFGGNTTPELCGRWYQLGAFYPFMINHDSFHSSSQDPAVFDKATQNIIRTALELRYTLLPYLNTLLYRSHVDGTTVVRPLFFQYPESKFDITYTVREQFMWGSGLLVTPALIQNITEGPGYLPKDGWYDYYTGAYFNSPGLYTLFAMPAERVNLQVRGGSIIPTQAHAVTTTQSRKNKFGLIVAMSETSTAEGELFWDDGEALDSISNNVYNLIQFNASKGVLTSELRLLGYNMEPMILGDITVMGVASEPQNVVMNGEIITNFSYSNKVLYVSNLNVNLLRQFQLTWK